MKTTFASLLVLIASTAFATPRYNKPGPAARTLGAKYLGKNAKVRRALGSAALSGRIRTVGVTTLASGVMKYTIATRAHIGAGPATTNVYIRQFADGLYGEAGNAASGKVKLSKDAAKAKPVRRGGEYRAPAPAVRRGTERRTTPVRRGTEKRATVKKTKPKPAVRRGTEKRAVKPTVRRGTEKRATVKKTKPKPAVRRGTEKRAVKPTVRRGTEKRTRTVVRRGREK